MTEIKMYKALDGEIFGTLVECLKYEEENFPSKDALEKIYLFDNELADIKAIYKSNDWLSYSNIYDNLHWFIIKNLDDDSLNCIKDILECGPYSYPEEFVEGDIYTWSDIDGWYNYSAKFREMKDNLKLIYKMLHAELMDRQCNCKAEGGGEDG